MSLSYGDDALNSPNIENNDDLGPIQKIEGEQDKVKGVVETRLGNRVAADYDNRFVGGTFYPDGSMKLR